MTSSTIKALAQDLCHDKADSSEMDTYISDTVEQICKMPNCPLVDTDTAASTSGTSDYVFPAAAVRIVTIFYNEIPLSYATVTELEAYDDDWRALTGDPRFFTIEDVDARKYTLVPQPDTSSDDIVVMFTDNRATDIEDWLGVHIALSALSREFARPSDHQDVAFSAACNEAAQLFFQAAGI